MIKPFIKNEIDYDDDIVVLTEISNGIEQIVFRGPFDSNFVEYEFNTEKFETGDDLFDLMSWNEDLNCFVYENLKLYIIGFKTI